MVAQSLYVEQQLTAYSHAVSEIAARNGLDRPPALALDEWTVRHFEPVDWPAPEPGDDGGVAPRETSAASGWAEHLRVNRWSPRTIADAVFCAGVFHAIHRTAGLPAPVAMANPVNLVNANGLVVARPKGAFRSAIYHVWHLYRHHTGRTVLPSDVDGPARSTGVRQGIDRDTEGRPLMAPMTVPYIDVCATRADDGSVRLAVVNRHRDQTIHVRPVFDGAETETPKRVHMRTLGGDISDLYQANDLNAPDAVGVRDLGEVEATGGTWAMPPHSVTVLSFDGRGR